MAGKYKIGSDRFLYPACIDNCDNTIWWFAVCLYCPNQVSLFIFNATSFFIPTQTLCLMLLWVLKYLICSAPVSISLASFGQLWDVAVISSQDHDLKPLSSKFRVSEILQNFSRILCVWTQVYTCMYLILLVLFFFFQTSVKSIDHIELLREQQKILAGEVALHSSSLKRLSEEAARDPQKDQIHVMSSYLVICLFNCYYCV